MKYEISFFVIVIFIFVAVVFVATFSLYWLAIKNYDPEVRYEHEWHYKFSKEDIINMTESDIKKKHGEFDKIWSTSQENYYAVGYLIAPDSGGFYNSQYPVYYNMYFTIRPDGIRRCESVCIEVIKGDENAHLNELNYQRGAN